MRIFAPTFLALLISTGTALAAQNVANTSQKGSLLIWPLINIHPTNATDTFIEISNDADMGVHVECYYVNGKKGRVDFDFDLSRKQTASWAVKTLNGDQVHPPVFPVSGTYPGSPYLGELICFATDRGAQHQIAFNHLTGTATVANLDDHTGRQHKQAFRYNAWSFVARNDQGLPERENVQQGRPGVLWLSGGRAGTYDACPEYNIANFMPNGAKLGNLTTVDNDLSVVSCYQDLRQDFKLNLTKLRFTVWNSVENSFTGAYICADSVDTVVLGAVNPNLVNGSNFDYSTLRTKNARFEVEGVASTQCPGSRDSALLGVLTSSISLPSGGEDQELGSTTQGAGAMPGYVFWDPRGNPPPVKP
jgi:hypothetical protein